MMNAPRPLITIVALSLSVFCASASKGQSNDSSLGAKPTVKDFRNLAIGFEANQGQADPAVRFLARGAGYGIYLTEREAVLAIRPSRSKRNPNGPHLHEDRAPADVVRMKLAGANPTAQPDGQDRLPGTANYFVGNDPAKWRTGVPTYAKVRYTEVYPGVDLVYYGNQRQLEYDFVVAPGESATPIRLSFNGARSVKLDAEGDLVLKSKSGEMVFRKPVAYQVIAGTRRQVESRFRILAGKSAGFWLGAYDRSAPLVIDPVLVYATLLGGNGLGGNQYGDAALAIATDAQGNAYVTGYTDSSDFPVSSPYDGTYNSEFGMAFVSKINASGTAFVYSTFLGGSWDDQGTGIAADSNGNAYVAGSTSSSDFPLVNPIQNASFINQFGQWHGFVTKINPSGQGLVYSTYLGGSGVDNVLGIAVDPSGNAYVTGTTSSQDFPTYNPLQATNKATTTNPLTGFVSKINPGGTGFVYSTYLGGSYADTAYSIAADSAGNAYVTGQALSSDFPVYNALQSKFVGTAGFSAAPFLSKIKPDGSGFIYSTYVGGGAEAPTGAGDSAYAVAADSNGDAYIVGEVLSTLDLPLVSALQTGLGPLGYGAFLSKVNPEGSALVYSTFIGDTNGASGVAVDSNENVYVTGQQYCPWDLPTPVNPIGTCATKGPPISPNVIIEAFIYEVAADGSGFTFASPYGGGGEYGYGIAVDPTGNVYVAGQTKYATAFPMVNAPDKTAEGQQEGFVLKVDMATSAPAAATPVISPSAGIYTTSQTVSISDTTPNATIYYTTNGTTPTISSTQYTGTFTVSSTETVEAVAFATGYSTSAVATEAITIEAPAATPVIAPAAGTYTSAQTVTISDTTAGATIYYTTNGTTPTTSSTVYSGPINVSSSETIEAIAASSGYTSSAVASAAYTINIPGAPSVSLTAQPNTGVVYGQSITLAATESPVEGIAQGYSWTISQDGTALVTGALSNGNGSYSMMTTPHAGQHSFIATYSSTQSLYPAGTSNTVSLTVAKATPTVSAWPTTSVITYGQTLASSTLSGGTASTTGTFAWTAPTTAPGAGTTSQSVTFTPTDATDYNTVTGTAPVTVNKATPTVTAWPTASSITVGQALSSSILSGGTPSVAGTFAWTSPSTVPLAGSYSGSVTFTPMDATDYNTVSGTVTVTVTMAAGFTLSPAPAAVSVAQGTSGTSTITVTDVGGFSGTVALAASGLPNGVTASFAAGPAPGTQVVTLTASTSAQVTSSAVTVTITGSSGAATATTSISLNITPQPSFTAGSGGTTSISVAPGATSGNTGTISIEGTNGFTGTINLSCAVTTSMTNVSDMPSCSLNPSSVVINGATVQTSTLTVSTTSATSSKSDIKKLMWPADGTALALVGFLVVPRRRRNWLAFSGMLLLFLSIGAAGCGSGGTTGGGNPGTTAGSYTITVTGSAGSVSATVGTIALTVQ